MTLYIAGPITGVVDYKARFGEAETALKCAGFGVINPATLPHKNEEDWQACMRLDITEMMRGADGVALLAGWFDSKGAFIEGMLARGLKIPVQMIDGWLGRRYGYGCTV